MVQLDERGTCLTVRLAPMSERGGYHADVLRRVCGYACTPRPVLERASICLSSRRSMIYRTSQQRTPRHSISKQNTQQRDSVIWPTRMSLRSNWIENLQSQVSSKYLKPPQGRRAGAESYKNSRVALFAGDVSYQRSDSDFRHGTSDSLSRRSNLPSGTALLFTRSRRLLDAAKKVHFMKAPVPLILRAHCKSRNVHC
jgi:hypothetical protein